MSTKIFVGNLPPGSTGADIHPLFEQYGTITECAVLGSFAFVHMTDEDEAKVAVNELNHFNLYGSQLRVELSIPATQGKMKYVDGTTSTKIFVGNLKIGTTDLQVQEIFEKYGTVTEAAVVGGFGFVHMSNTAEAKAAIKALNGYILNGQPISVEVSTKETQGKSKTVDAPQFDRFRGGAGRGGFRGRGRGMASTRFDPYLAHAGGAGGWMGRSDPYDSGLAGGELYAQQDPYRQSMLHAPSAAAARPSAAAAGAAYASQAASASDDASFARDLLKLYSENPAAFDAYARHPVVRKSLKLDNQEQQAAAAAAVYDETGLKAPRDYYAEPRGLAGRIPSQVVAPNYGGALTAQSSMLAASSGALGLPRRGGLGAGLRQSGPTLGYRANQSQFYMSFE